MPSKYHRYVFDITWYINNHKIVTKNKLPYNNLTTDGVLFRKDWKSNPNGPNVLGFRVMCKMRARQNSVSVPTPYNSSDAFYAGAKLQKTTFTVKSGSEVTINITSTVPVACVNVQGRTLCEIQIELFSLKDQFQSRPANCNESLSDEEIKMSKSTCRLVFDGTKWETYHSFKLQTLSDQALRSSYKCSAKLIAKSSIDSLWQNYQLPEVYIHVFKEVRPYSYCYSYNDPHIRTFDGRYFATHEKGEFVLFRHKTKPIEVHSIQRWENNNKWASNCAVIFRAATDMFVIYGCNTPTRWIARRLNCESEQQYLEVFERGSNYEVIMPTGTRIKVYVKPSWLNIHVVISPSDWEQVEGLCGTYNGNSGDDFSNRKGNTVSKTEMIRSWEVPGPQSLFIARSRTEKLKTEVLYCSCYNRSLISDLQPEMKETADCTWKESLPLCKPMNWKDNKCRNYGRTKREIADDFEFDIPIDVVIYEKGPQNFEWKNGWTEQKAVNACESYFTKSKMFRLCSKIIKSSGVDKTTCVADIKISGSDVFLSASLDSMTSSCLNEITMNTTFWKPKPKLQTTTTHSIQLDRKTQSTTRSTTTNNLDIAEEQDISILDIAETVFNNDCPNDCSQSGICQQGTCECDNGFEGEDCSVDRRKEPELFGLIEESFCDLSKRPCAFISVFGNGFYASGNVKCRIMEAQIVLHEVKSDTLNVTTDGSLITFAEVKCPLEQMDHSKSQNFPVLDAYLVSVSFDDIKYSKGSPIIVYDSTCTTCKDVNGTVDCRMREDVCVVERKCYHQEHNMCKPSTTFSPRKQTISSTKLYENSMQTTSSEILHETSEQTTSSNIMYETSEQTTSSEKKFKSSETTTSLDILYEPSEQTTSSEKLYETSEQTTNSEKLYETVEQTNTQEILYEPRKQTTSSEKLYQTSEQTTSSEKTFKISETTTSLDTLHETSKQTTSSEKLYEHSKQTISPEIFYLGAVLGGLGIVVVPTLLLIRK